MRVKGLGFRVSGVYMVILLDSEAELGYAIRLGGAATRDQVQGLAIPKGSTGSVGGAIYAILSLGLMPKIAYL